MSLNVTLHLRQLAELLPQAFGFRLVTMLNCPFKEQVGSLDLLDEIVSLRHCHSYFSSLHPKSLW